jgi:hypothetical protein
MVRAFFVVAVPDRPMPTVILKVSRCAAVFFITEDMYKSKKL